LRSGLRSDLGSGRFDPGSVSGSNSGSDRLPIVPCSGSDSGFVMGPNLGSDRLRLGL
jgi:hypothetical protein